MQVFIGNATPDRICVSIFPCEMPFKQAEEILEEKEIMEQKLLSSPFDVLLIALCRLQRQCLRNPKTLFC